jgi:hypothetical protein
MKPVIRYQSQLLFRKSYKPNRLIRIRPVAKPTVTFRPVRRFGVKPQLELVSYSKGVCPPPQAPADNRKMLQKSRPCGTGTTIRGRAQAPPPE